MNSYTIGWYEKIRWSKYSPGDSYTWIWHAQTTKAVDEEHALLKLGAKKIKELKKKAKEGKVLHGMIYRVSPGGFAHPGTTIIPKEEVK